jgi:hypothetical protein
MSREVDAEEAFDVEVFPVALSQLTGVPVEKLLRVQQGEDPRTVYSAEDKAALAGYARFAAQSRRVRRVFREVSAQRQARTIFDHVMEDDDGGVC